MDKLVELHLRHLDNGVSPEVEAAWLHHRFTQIHPFQDGNGRIARALASLVFISSGWFPLIITRDDRAPYLDALEEADQNGLGALIELFVSRQRRAFVSALGIVHEVTGEGERLDHQLAAIADLFSRRDNQLRQELDRAKQLARSALSWGIERFNTLTHKLESSISAPGTDRKVFQQSAYDDDSVRRTWHKWQIVQVARDLGYFASLRDFACWTVLILETESGRSEILLSLHQVGQEFRGVIGASVAFYRKQEVDDQRRAVDIQAASDDVFQINYKDSEDEVKKRFERWLDRSLVRALDAWRRSE
jgi:hypothetical protein